MTLDTTKPFRIYITNAGQTANYMSGKFLHPADNQFKPDAYVILTSQEFFGELSQQLPQSVDDRKLFKFVKLDNSLRGTGDYFPTITRLLQAVTDICQESQRHDVELIVNMSGGTTKYMVLLSDFALLSGMIFPVQQYFGIYDTKKSEVSFTLKPALRREDIESLLAGTRARQESVINPK